MFLNKISFAIQKVDVVKRLQESRKFQSVGDSRRKSSVAHDAKSLDIIVRT